MHGSWTNNLIVKKGGGEPTVIWVFQVGYPGIYLVNLYVNLRLFEFCKGRGPSLYPSRSAHALQITNYPNIYIFAIGSWMPLYLYCYQNGPRQQVLFYLCNMTHLINRLTNAPSVLLHYPLKVFTIDNYKILPMLSPVIPIITINNHQYKNTQNHFR